MLIMRRVIKRDTHHQQFRSVSIHTYKNNSSETIRTETFYSQILTHTKINLLNMYDDHHGTKQCNNLHIQIYNRNENVLTGTAIFWFMYTMNYNIFNNIGEIYGKVSKALIQKVPHKGEFHLYNHRKSNYRRNVYVFLVYGIEISHLINSGNAHENAGYNQECTDSTSQFAHEEYNHLF